MHPTGISSGTLTMIPPKIPFSLNVFFRIPFPRFLRGMPHRFLVGFSLNFYSFSKIPSSDSYQDSENFSRETLPEISPKCPK